LQNRNETWQLAGGTLLARPVSVNVSFVSTLTSEDENRIAPVILKAIADILDLVPVAYVLRIDTVDAHVYQISKPSASESAVVPFVPRGGAKSD
jgi:hypothetical protein